MLTDPVGDMITRIRNAHMRYKKEVVFPSSSLKKSILDVLVREGYIASYEETSLDKDGKKKTIKVALKYYNRRPVITQIRRVSKPSVKMYTSLRDIGSVANGLGNLVLSTSLGVLSDREAKMKAVGGKILLTIR